MSIFATRAPVDTSLVHDERAIYNALSVLADQDHGVMLQVLPSGAWRVAPAGDLKQLVSVVKDLARAGGTGVYVTLNPVPPTLDRPARVGDVISRRWLLVDVDTKRAEPDSSSTDAEKGAARDVAEAVRCYLSDCDWPAPVVVDSGNGWHLLYRVDLPATEHSRTLIKAVLAHLADRFDSESVTIDRKVADARRITKLPGTWTRKGTHTEERPHRPALLVYVPDPPGIVTAEQLAALASPETTAPPAAPAANGTGDANGINGHHSTMYARAANGTADHAWAAKALDNECARVRMAAKGDRNNTLNLAACKLGNIVAAGLMQEEHAAARLFEAAMNAGLSDHEIRATIKSGLTAGKQRPREPKPKAEAKPAASAVPPGESILVRGTEITPRKVSFLWNGRIPCGKLTTFAGIGGLGKTFVLCDIAARITTGRDWPDSLGECCDPGQVLFISGEDDKDDTLVPRLIECGADLSRVLFLKTEVEDRFTLADLATLELAISQSGPDLRLVVIDPPTAYLGGVDDHKNSELRAVLAPLKSFAARHRLALVFNTHVNKAGKVEAMMRVMGSVAWVNAVRAAHLFARDPEDPEKVIFVPMKMNLARRRKGLAYRITETTDLARVEWLGEVDTTADEAVNAAPKSRDIVAADWLVERFREKIEWESEELFKVARNCGISRNAIFAAKAKLNLPKARKVTQENGDQMWVWHVPPDWPALKTVGPVGTVGTLDKENQPTVPMEF